MMQSGVLAQRAEKGREEVEKDRVGCRSYFICICSQGSSQANIYTCKIEYYQYQMSQCAGD